MPQKTILVVEDNPNNLALFEIILRSLDAEILTARNGHEALEKIVSNKPDLTVLDVQIPGISGLEVAARVRAMPEFQEMPIVAVTSYAMKGDREKILAAGVDYYVPKPIDTRAFPKVIKDFLYGGERGTIDLANSIRTPY
ncbi:MAG: response regulator [Promethearchaeota archaeon]